MSTKAEPTPGEWIADNNGYIHAGGRLIGEATMDGHGRWPANARLFAASKDLLRELEFAYAYLKNEAGGPEWRAGIERMRQAIEKAKGDQ